MSITDYIVPIFEDNEYNGTGFIVHNYLITAAHVVKKNGCSYAFLYQGNVMGIDSKKIFLYEYPMDKSLQGLNNRYLDLVVYKFNNIFSPLVFRTPDLKAHCIYQGYSYSNSILHFNSYDNIFVKDHDWYTPDGGETIRINNTYLSTIGKCESGNSGGPLIQGDMVVGMLVGNEQYSSLSMDRYIKSEYILAQMKSICL